MSSDCIALSCQVWIRHPSIGFCNFREIYPKSDLSNILFPGKSVLCWARNVPPTREVTYQATVVWLESEPPSESIYRTPDLVQELNFHLAEYSSGGLSSLDTVNATPTKLRSVEGVVQEWISHEVGLVRLDDGGVALFHIAQAWAYRATWVQYTTLMTKPACLDYLALGTTVLLAVRPLAASEASELRYQALIIWNKEVCRAEEERQGVGRGDGMFSRRQVEEGDLPLSWVQEMAGDVSRTALLTALDTTWDSLKRLARLDLKSITPVAAVLNLLPLNWEAKIVKMVDSDNGVISVQHREAGTDLSGDLGLGVTNMFVMFNIEDVFGVTGDRYRTGPDTNVPSILGQPVDLTARCIVSEGASIASVYHTAASQSMLAMTSASPVSCPILQAVCVYLKTCDTSAPVTLFSPRPTRLRSVPESVDIAETSTSFYLSYLLSAQLDVKEWDSLLLLSILSYLYI